MLERLVKMRRYVLAAALPLLAGCDPGTVEIEIPDYDAESDSYVIRPVEVSTLHDVGRLEGRATRLVGGADLTLNYVEGNLTWNDGGHPVAFSALRIDDVLVPEDFDSLAMAATYANVERSMLFYERDLDLPVDDVLVDLETYYWPALETVETGEEKLEITDNAYYMRISDDERAFFVFPFEDFQWLPMSMNGGILTHEYTHAVFDALVHDPSATTPLSASAANFLYGLNEGCADWMAVARTGDPDYMEHSIRPGIFGIECNGSMVYEIVRDASDHLHYQQSWDYAARHVEPEAFCPYDVGAFFASLMYAVAERIDGGASEGGAVPSRQARIRVSRWLLGALEDLGVEMRPDFELWDLIGLFVLGIEGSGDREKACLVIEERYEMYSALVQGC